MRDYFSDVLITVNLPLSALPTPFNAVMIASAMPAAEMQGYLFSAPKPAAEIRSLLAAHRPQPEASRPSRPRKRKPVARTA